MGALSEGRDKVSSDVTTLGGVTVPSIMMGLHEGEVTMLDVVIVALDVGGVAMLGEATATGEATVPCDEVMGLGAGEEAVPGDVTGAGEVTVPVFCDEVMGLDAGEGDMICD